LDALELFECNECRKHPAFKLALERHSTMIGPNGVPATHMAAARQGNHPTTVLDTINRCRDDRIAGNKALAQ
jgi:hypothetical protein